MIGFLRLKNPLIGKNEYDLIKFQITTKTTEEVNHLFIGCQILFGIEGVNQYFYLKNEFLTPESVQNF